jgi:hypothetical protein
LFWLVNALPCRQKLAQNPKDGYPENKSSRELSSTRADLAPTKPSEMFKDPRPDQQAGDESDS